jgi:hypothetical protein
MGSVQCRATHFQQRCVMTTHEKKVTKECDCNHGHEIIGRVVRFFFPVPHIGTLARALRSAGASPLSFDKQFEESDCHSDAEDGEQGKDGVVRSVDAEEI